MLSIEQVASKDFNLLSYVIHDEASGECLIIDPPRRIEHRTDIDSLRIKATINTHIHPDHTMGNKGLAEISPVLAHPDENTWFLRSYNTLFSFFLTGRIQPRISFTLSENVCLYWEGNLISGDTVFAEGIGRTDIPGGSMAHLKKSITRIMGLPEDTLIWPGHSYGNKMKATLGDIRPYLSWVIRSL
jgi:hydroxyacylglutathione hydrolase